MNNYIKNEHDLIGECLNHMADNNLACLEPINPNGKWQRYAANRERRAKDESYIMFLWSWNGRFYLICLYGSWRTGEKHIFKSYEKSTLSDHERQYLAAEYKKKKEEADKLSQESHDNAAIIAQKIWDEAPDTPPSSEYLTYPNAKGIGHAGARFIFYEEKPTIIIPLKNILGEIRLLQRIFKDVDGTFKKRFLPYGGQKTGNFDVLGELTHEIIFYVVEGWATGKSVFMTGLGPVIIAYDAYNIGPVVERIRSKFPNNVIIIAGDNDPSPHTGQKYANLAAQKYGCKTVFPQFPEKQKTDIDGKPYTDFNDLHQLCGIDEVKRQLQGINTAPPTTHNELRNLAETLLTKKDPCIDFSLSSLPSALREYIESICKTTNADPMMITMAALTTISAFLCKRVSYPHYFQPLHPNVWMLAIAKSGQFKTTALNKGASLAWKQHAHVMAEIKEIEQKIRTTTNDVEKLNLEEERLAISLTDVILPTKITGEALLEHLSQGHTGVILASEFGGFLQNLAKSHNNDLKPLFTDLYDVPAAYRYKTRTQGDLILEQPCFSICGVSTLTWLQGNIKTSDVASGFFARFLIFTPVHKNDIPPALPTFDVANFEEEENNLAAILKQVESPHLYNPLKGDAKLFFESIHEKIYIMIQSYSDRNQEILEPYLKRWSPYLLKLAMIMQAVEDPLSKDISSNAMLAAIGILFAAMQSTKHLFEEELNESENESKCQKVFEWICKQVKKSGKPVRRQAIFSSKQIDGGYDYILTTLIEQGKIMCEETKEKVNWLYRPNNQQVEDL